jgi:hypothetical protein
VGPQTGGGVTHPGEPGGEYSMPGTSAS